MTATGKSLTRRCKYLPLALKFLQSIGIPAHLVPGSQGFIDHIRIKQGSLEVDPTCPVSNLLHEAGHLAVVPQRFRTLMDGNLDDSFAVMFEQLHSLDLPPDDALVTACLQSSECEATAWAWAAGEHLGIPPKVRILDEEYAGDGETVRLQLMARAYFGINGLAHAGFCVTRARPGVTLPAYPKLAYWLQR
jgi:hypothetical protein